MNLQQQKANQVPIGSNAEQIKEKWRKYSGNYVQVDSTPQTFYYTLANMLKLNEARNVLQIACGAGKLIPHVLDLKSEKTFYYATDISEQMICFAKSRLQKLFKRYQSRLTFYELMSQEKLQFGVVNGQEKLQKQIKFDRIICNLVLMLTTDPRKMLDNLYNHAEQGCLMGLSVWGNKKALTQFHLLKIY